MSLFAYLKTRLQRVLVTSALLCVATCGCSRFQTEYGDSDGSQGNKSVNGFGAFRSALADSSMSGTDPSMSGTEATSEAMPIKTRDLSRLSSKAKRYDSIVWVPKSWPPANAKEVQNWMNRWLRRGHKTMVFVAPDGGSTEAYFREASSLAPPEQRLEYRRRLASQINDRLLAEDQRRDVKMDGWFVAKAFPYRVILPNRQIIDYEVVPAPLPIDEEKDGTELDLDDIDMSDFDADELMAEIDAMLEDDANLDEHEVDSKPSDVHPIRLEALREEEVAVSGRPKTLTTLARVTDSRWNDSQILVVASGSLVTNFALTEEPAIEMAKQIRQSIGDVSQPDSDKIQVGFLSSDFTGIPISNVKPGAPKSTGMELMTTWPLSLVAMHGLFLGVVMCLMLLPAFGRARRVTYNRTTHFGNHLSAMATLMRRGERGVDGKHYARKKISQYLKIVRGETSGPWILAEPTPEPVISAANEDMPATKP